MSIQIIREYRLIKKGNNYEEHISGYMPCVEYTIGNLTYRAMLFNQANNFGDGQLFFNYTVQLKDENDQWIDIPSKSNRAEASDRFYVNTTTGRYEDEPFEEVDDLSNPRFDDQGNQIGYYKKSQLKANMMKSIDFYVQQFDDILFPLYFTLLRRNIGAE